MASVTLQKLRKSYELLTVVHDIDLEIADGELEEVSLASVARQM